MTFPRAGFFNEPLILGEMASAHSSRIYESPAQSLFAGRCLPRSGQEFEGPASLLRRGRTWFQEPVAVLDGQRFLSMVDPLSTIVS